MSTFPFLTYHRSENKVRGCVFLIKVVTAKHGHIKLITSYRITDNADGFDFRRVGLDQMLGRN